MLDKLLKPTNINGNNNSLNILLIGLIAILLTTCGIVIENKSTQITIAQPDIVKQAEITNSYYISQQNTEYYNAAKNSYYSEPNTSKRLDKLNNSPTVYNSTTYKKSTENNDIKSKNTPISPSHSNIVFTTSIVSKNLTKSSKLTNSPSHTNSNNNLSNTPTASTTPTTTPTASNQPTAGTTNPNVTTTPTVTTNTSTVAWNGVCSTTIGSCVLGTASTITNGEWTCTGQNGGTTETCQVVNGVCGTTAGTCARGTVSEIVNNFTPATAITTWNCNGVDGGSNASCSLNTCNAPAPQTSACATDYAGSGIQQTASCSSGSLVWTQTANNCSSSPILALSSAADWDALAVYSCKELQPNAPDCQNALIDHNETVAI